MYDVTFPPELVTSIMAPTSAAGSSPPYFSQFLVMEGYGDVGRLRAHFSGSSQPADSSNARASALTRSEVQTSEATSNSDELALIARRRVAILAARNGTAKPSVEIIARLEQLNARIKHHAPLVTQEQINYLEAAVATREELAAKRKARGERWGI